MKKESQYSKAINRAAQEISVLNHNKKMWADFASGAAFGIAQAFGIYEGDVLIDLSDAIEKAFAL